MSKIAFPNSQSLFFRSLKDKVDNYFVTNKIHTSGNKSLFFKGLFLVASAVSIYITLVFFTPTPLISIFLCVLLGINFAAIGFNIMHEGVHNSFSKHKWLNDLSRYFLNIMGGSNYFWKIKHNINHHTYTNIEGMDSDIDVEPMMRLHPNQPRRWFHKFQHIYWVVLYGLSYLAWVFQMDFQKYFSGNVSLGFAKKKMELKEHFIFWATKLGFITLYLIIPGLMVGFLNAVIGFLILTFVCGLFIAVVFQLAHVVEDTEFPTPNPETNKMENEWAIHQISTTANFATKNKLICWLMGGLNFQVEHHLFPKISHIHYPKISEIVKETCEEFNITYIEYRTFFRALGSHLSHIKTLGKA